MEYHLDRKITLVDKPEHRALYDWCLQEVDESRGEIGACFVPWEWRVDFTANEVAVVSIYEKPSPHFLKEDEKKNKSNPVEESNYIFAQLVPGVYVDENEYELGESYSFFGSKRNIRKFTLRIVPTDSESERCHIAGIPSYTAEVDFCQETTEDTLEIILGISKERYSRLESLLLRKAIDKIGFSMKNVDGFYSEWTPSISTDRIKVLARGSEQQLHIPENSEISPPRLGEVFGYSVSFSNRQTFYSADENTSDLVLTERDTDIEGVPTSKGKANQVGNDQHFTRELFAIVLREQKKLLTGIWMIVAALIAILFMIWI